MQRMYVAIPLALVQIKAVLRETSRVNNAKIRVFCNIRPCTVRARPLPVIRGRLADIVKARPDKFTCIKGLAQRNIQPVACQMPPAYPALIVRRQPFVSLAAVPAVCFAVVYAAAVNRGRRF